MPEHHGLLAVLTLDLLVLSPALEEVWNELEVFEWEGRRVRIVSAAGYAGPVFDPKRLDVAINGTTIYSSGSPVFSFFCLVSGKKLKFADLNLLTLYIIKHCWPI